MVYVNFMGPFVLKSYSDGLEHPRYLRTHCCHRSRSHRSSDDDLFLFILSLIGFVLSAAVLICYYALYAIGFLIYGAMLGVVYTAVGIASGMIWLGKKIGKAFKKKRCLTQTDTDSKKLEKELLQAMDKPDDKLVVSTLTKEQKIEINKKIEKYTKRLSDRLGLDKKEEEAHKSSLKKKASKFWNWITNNKGGKINPSQTEDEFKISYRDLYDDEIEDIKK